MLYKEALRLVEKNQHLIGRKYKGAIIDDIIVFPQKESSMNFFFELYSQTLNYEESISSFMDEQEFYVAVICEKDKLHKMGYFAPVSIDLIENSDLEII